MSPEDDRAAELATEKVVVAFWLEVLFPQTLGDLFQVLLFRPPLSRMGQRVFVDICRVDLGALPVLRCAECLGEEHGHAVCFLAGSDPSAPHPDRLVRCFALDDLRKNLVSQVLPGGGIPKVAGDIDQDGVEERGKFLRMGLEVIEIRGVAFDADLRHPLFDPAEQCGSLVAAEVEASSLSQVLQQALEVGTIRLVRHFAISFMTSVTRAGAISSSGRMKSGVAGFTAAPGMPPNSAEAWSCATTVPPIFLIAPTPIEPSKPVPVSTTAIARCLKLAPADPKNTAALGRTKWTSSDWDSERVPSRFPRRWRSGGAMCTVPGRMWSPSAACTTSSAVRRRRMSAIKLRWRGSRCCTTTMAAGNSDGRLPNTSLRAAIPPADAARATTSKAAPAKGRAVFGSSTSSGSGVGPT